VKWETIMSKIKDNLLEIEKAFWTGDEAFYKEHVDKDCLVAFEEMSGVMSNAKIAATVKDGNRWRDLKIDAIGAVEPKEDVTILSYEVKAVRQNGEPYAALVSSGYVKRGNDWKMMFHTQTPHHGKDAAHHQG
jgi:hypothetical protein